MPRSLAPAARPPAAPRRAPMRRSLVIPLLAALTLLSAACIRTEVSIQVNEDGSGVMSFLVAFDRQVMEALDAFGDETDDFDEFDPETLAAEFDTDDLPPGATVEPYEDGNFAGFRVVVPFEEGDDIAATLARIASDAGGDDPLAADDGPFEALELLRDGDTWRFAARIDPAADDTFDEFGDDDGSLDFARALFGEAMFTVRLNLPGDVTEHNADAVEDDGTLRWEIDLFSDQARDLRATSDIGGGFSLPAVGEVSGAWLLVGGLVVVGLLIALAGWLAVRASPASERE